MVQGTSPNGMLQRMPDRYLAIHRTGPKNCRCEMTRPLPESVKWSALPSTKTVANRDAVALNIARAEFDVVVNQVEAHFWPNENVMPDVGANAAPNVSHEVIAAGVIGEARQGIEVWVSVKSQILAADSTEQLSRNVLSKLGGPDCIDSVENRTIWFDASVLSLTRPPGELSFDSQTPGYKEVRADARVQTAAVGGKGESLRGCGCARGDRAEAKCCVELLSVGGTLKKTEYKKGGN
jgi:hypothetical protein